MKKTLLLLFLSIIFYNSIFAQVDVQKAKLNCVVFLKMHLDDPGSYKSAGWGKLEKVYKSPDLSLTVVALDQKIKKFKDVKEQLEDYVGRTEAFTKRSEDLAADTNYKHAIFYIKQNDSIVNVLLKQRIQAFGHPKPTLDHYYIEHMFRAKNAFNALRLATFTFFLDKNFHVTDYDTKSAAGQAQELIRERNKIMNDIQKSKEGGE